MIEQTQKRFRKKSVKRQLQQALDAAQALDGASPDELTISKMKLVQSRLDVLTRMQTREKTDKGRKLKAELAGAKAEIDSLKAELAAAQAEIARLQNRPTLFDVTDKIKQVEAEYYAAQEKA